MPKQRGTDFGPGGREPPAGLDRRSTEELGHAVVSALATQVATGGVLVNERGEILHFYGRTGEFIEICPGEPTFDLLQRARTDLRPRLLRALEAARRTNSDLPPGEVREPGVRVIPIAPAETSRPRHFLVLFEAASRDSGVFAAAGAGRPATARDDTLRSMAEDRAAAYEELRTMNEELSAANAEMHAINDELAHNRDELGALASALRTRNAERARANAKLKRAAQEARAAWSRATAIVETVPIPLVTVNGAFEVTAANRAFCDLVKRPHSAIVGKPILEHWRDEPRAVERLQAAIERAMRAGGATEDVEFEAELPEMGTRTLLVGARAIPAEGGEAQLLVALWDTTERKRRVEEQQRARAGRAQRLLNESGRLLLSEPLGSEEGLSKLVQLVVPEIGDVCAIDLLEGARCRRAAFASSRGTEEPTGSLDERQVRALIEAERPIVMADPEASDPRFGWLRELGMRFCIGLPLRARGVVRGALWVGRRVPPRDGGHWDLSVAEGLSQRAGLALENAELFAEAKAAIEVREEFLGIASHELRTPLFALQLHLEHLNEMLRDRSPDLAKGAEKVSRAVVQTHRMGRLIESLVAVSRIMAGKLVLERERVDVGELVTDIVERMRPEAQRAGCRLETSVQSGVTGSFDPLRIEQVVTNLLTNAFRYARGVAVCVGVEGDRERARIRVEDRGPGIPMERRAHVFERFETGSQRSVAGLGLGLYISRQLIEAHGGTLELEPSETGASFLATLPREPVVN